jgi:hypothetical protein
MGKDKTQRTRVTRKTREAEAREAVKDHGPGPVDDEEAQAWAPSSVDPEVAAHEKEMAERGAHQKGEGRIP